MIPNFPEFKKLELSDKKDVEKFTSKFPPYSDFNFVSMWSWDIKGEMLLSVLNDNLVVRFTDYITGKPFYSFLGNNIVNETAEVLLELSKNEGLKVELKLVPEDSVKTIDQEKFKVKEDRDNFDYIFTTDSLSKMEGGRFEIKRKHCRFFKKKFPHTIKILDLNNPLTKNEIVNLFNDWVADKKGEKPTDYYKNEFIALSRFLNSSESINFFVVGIYLEKKLIAVSITENTHHAHNLGHFQKARLLSFKGINDHLVHELASLLNKKDITHMNHEQDLGILGLRESKESYIPSHYLKKFSLSTGKSSDIIKL